VDVVEDWDLGFHLGNVIKYIARYKDKGGLVDIKKADWYLDRFIEMQTGHKQDINETNKTPDWEPCVIRTTPESGVVVKPPPREEIIIPNKDFTASSQDKYRPIRYKGGTYEYTYTMGDDAYFTRVSEDCQGTGVITAFSDGANSACVDGLG
jgi:hypothetical protein